MSDIRVEVSVGISARPTSFDKATKLEANYRRADDEDYSGPPPVPRGRMDHMEIPAGAPSTPGDRGERCGTCDHYSGYRSCEIVVGVIEPEYVCDWWEGEE